MRYFIISILALLMMSCQSQLPTDDTTAQTPKHLLSEEVFTNLYYDAQLTEAAVRIEIGKGAKSKEISRYLYDQLFQRYGISESDFKENLRYYASDPSKMQEIQTEVVNRLTKKEAELMNQ